MDLSGDTQIWLIGLIGFLRAWRERERERETLTRLLQTHQGSTEMERAQSQRGEQIENACKRVRGGGRCTFYLESNQNE